MRDLLIRVGLTIGLFWFLTVAVLAIADGQIFKLPNHTVIIKDQGIHIYDNAITFDFDKIEEEK